MKRYRVTLTKEERGTLEILISSGKGAANKLLHARILLKADQSSEGPGWEDQPIAKALECGRATVERVRRRFVEEGFESALVRKPTTRTYLRKIDGKAEAHLVAACCSDPPKGRVRWTLKLLADKLVALGQVKKVSRETVRQTLKKTSLSPGWSKAGACRRAPTRILSPAWRTC
jgi:transposase